MAYSVYKRGELKQSGFKTRRGANVKAQKLDELEGAGHYSQMDYLSEEDKSKFWIHREQKGVVRGVQRLGFKKVNRRESFWGGKQ